MTKRGERTFDVAVVGGGFAGLAAATALVERGRTVCVLESAPHLGGRAVSYRDRVTGDEVDNGAHVLLGAYRETRRFLARIGSQETVRFQDRLAIAFREGEIETLFRTARLPAPFHLLAGLMSFRGLPAASRWAAARFGAGLRFGPLPGASESLAGWWRRTGQDGFPADRLWTPLATAALNEAPERASARLFAEVMRRSFFGTAADSAIGFPARPLSELHAIPGAVWIEARGGEIRLRSAVRSIRTKGNAGAELSTARGTVRARAVVLATPPTAARAILLSSGLPAAWRAEVDVSSPIVGATLWFDRPVYDGSVPVTGLWGSAAAFVFDRGALLHDGSRAGRVLSLVISDARGFLPKSTAEIAATASREISRHFPRARLAKLVHAAVRKEPHATFAGSPTAQEMRPGSRTASANLFLAGDWTDTKLPGTIEGACLSGHRAAEAAAAIL